MKPRSSMRSASSRTKTSTSRNDRGRQPEVPPIGAEAVGDLARELARRAEHEGAAAAPRRLAHMLGEMMQDRQREGRGLAGAGLGDAAEVAAGHHVRDGLGLDRGRGFVAFGGERLLDRGGEAEAGEVGQGLSLSTDAMSPSPAGSARW